MGHRVISAWKDDVKMQVFGDQLIAANYECPEERPRTVARGKKRKLEEEEESHSYECSSMDEGSVYVVHRQSIYDISMCKLNRYRQIPEQSLRRSVLICNTVRTIEREMVSEGMELDAAAASTFLPTMQTDSITLDPIPTTDYQPYMVGGGVVPLEPRSGCDGCEPGYGKSLTDLDCLSGRATPFPPPESNSCRTVSQLVSGSAAWDEADERLQGTCISWSSVLDFSSQSDISEDAWHHQHITADSTEVAGGPNTSPSASSDSGISTASDEIFGDIDLSLYDFDLLPLSPPNTRVVPPSAEELLHAFTGERAMVRGCPLPSFVQVTRSLPSSGCYRHDESERIVHVPPGPP